MISSSGESVSTSTSYRDRRSSTPESAIASRTSIFTLPAPCAAPSSLRRCHGALERLERARDRDASLDVGAELGQRELDGGERARDVEHVEPADVTDAEDLPLQVTLARRERDAVA